MKRFISLFVLVFYLFSFQPSIYAASNAADPSVYDTIHKSEKTASHASEAAAGSSPSIFPLFLKFLVSFVIVILLLYVVLRFLSKRNRIMPSNGPILSLGGQSLGANKSVQILLIGQTIYIVGVGESVTLLRTISQGEEEYQRLLKSFENQGEGRSPSISIDTKKLWDSVFRKHLQNMKRENGGE